MEQENRIPRLQNPTPVLVGLLIVAAFLIGMLWTKVQFLEGKGGLSVAGTTTENTPTPQAPTAGKIRPVSDSDHIRGDKNAQVTLVEYSDFECPWCQRFHPTMQQVMKEYDGKVRWVYRHFFPVPSHLRAQPTALSSECVASLGGNDKFWKYADKLFEIAPDLTDDRLKNIAIELGIDGNKFDACLSSKQFIDRINKDNQEARDVGIGGTPGGFVIDSNGNMQRIPGAIPYESLKQLIEEALKN